MNYASTTRAPTSPAVLTELLGVFAVAIIVMGSLTGGYHQQGYSAGPASTEPISGLMFFTLGASLIVAAGAYLYFLRKRRNRAIAQNAISEG
jgi:hypothetical protein